MEIAIHECKHCGEEYHFQWSGNYDAVDVPREHRDTEYCPVCKKAIYDALAKIPVKFKYEHVITDEVNLDTLLKWEKENDDEQSKNGGLIARRILAGLWDSKTGESQKVREVIGRDDERKGREYFYCYWPSDPKNCIITVNRRVNQETKEPGKYFKRRNSGIPG